MNKKNAKMYTPFGKRVKIALVERDMKNLDLAQLLGCTESTISDVLKGRNQCERRKDEILQILHMDE